MPVRRQPKGSPGGGRFAPDTRGKHAPTSAQHPTTRTPAGHAPDEAATSIQAIYQAAQAKGAVTAPATRSGADVAHRETWDAGFERLQAWVEANGRLPRQRETGSPEATEVAKWLKKQRERAAGTRGSRLDAEQLAKLESLRGFALNQRQASWDEKAQVLRDYYADPNRPVPLTKTTVYRGHSVGQWVHDYYRGRHTQTTDRSQALIPDHVRDLMERLRGGLG